MKFGKIRRMAAGILGVGEKRIWLNPEEGERIGGAMTRDDVRGLIKDGIVKKRTAAGQSRGRARVLKAKKRKGLRRGPGKRKGTFKVRAQKRASWITGVRGQRRVLREMKKKGVKTKISYRKIYVRIKGGYFKGKKYVEALGEKK